MKLIFEITMISGKKYKVTREEVYDSKDKIVELFEKEVLESDFISVSNDLKLRTNNIESYSVILGAN